MSGFTIDMDVSGLLHEVDSWEAAVEEAIRPAAQAGAQVVYDTVKGNVNKLGRKTGNLAASIYQVFSTGNSGQHRAEYHISWNYKKAPHGHLVEYGHVQRYITYIDNRGQWKTLVRPEKRGKRPPGRKASQAIKDAYFVPLKGGPRWVPPRSFLRGVQTPAIIAKARHAMISRFWEVFDKRKPPRR